MLHRTLCLMAASAALLAAEGDTSRRIDDVFKQWSSGGTPGAAVAVIKDGHLTYQKGFGRANLEYEAPIAPETVFHVASVSKQFTAMALVLLEQDGKLTLEDDIRKYLPELPDYGTRVTIRNLLQHTGGIRDQWQTLALAGWRLDDVITQKQILRMLFRQRELNFEPGTRHLYSNGGFTLAAEIVARVSGKPMPEFCEERIFRPLGMSHTHFHDDHRRIVPNRAYSYEPAGGGYRASPLNYANVGATSLFTTAPDLAKWLDNFREPKVGGAKAITRLEEQAVLKNGETVPYGLGLSMGTYRGLRFVSHGGSDAGYRSYVVWLPEHRLGIAVVSNLSNFNATSIANQVAAIYLERQMTDSPPKAPAPSEARTYVTLEPGAIDGFEGYYRLGDTLIQVVKKDGKLLASPPGSSLLELKPLSPVRFYAEPMQAEVEFAKTATGMKVKLTRSGGTLEGERTTFTPFDPKDMEKYPGTYWSDELETQYTVLLKDGRLFADHAHHGEIALTPIAKDQFGGAAFFMPEVKFTRDAGGKITGVTIGGNRVTGIRFVRR